jgi:predicted permease
MEQEAPKDHAVLKIVVTPWSEVPEEKYRLTLIFVLAAVGLVMSIACADAGGLLLSRAVQRQKEIAIRASLGAGLWRIVRQLLCESLVLAVMGSLAGIAAARALLQLLTRQLAALPIVLPHLQRVSLNGRVLAFNAVLCLFLAIVCSLAPILLAARTDLQSVMRGGHAAARPRGSSRLFSTLIALEAGLAFLLLVGSGLMIRSLVRLQNEDHGFRPDHVLTLRVPVGTLSQPRPTGKYDTRPRQMAYYREILERVKTVPGIKAAGIVNNMPLSGINSSISEFGLPGPDGKPELMSARTVSPQYFAAMGVPLIAGRDFADSDQTGAPSVAIINEYLARRLFPNRSPLGENLKGASNSAGPTIVGVVKDASQMSYELPAKAEVYIPYQQYIFATFMSTIVVRTEGEPTALAAALRKQVWAVDPNQPVVKVETMDDVIANSIWRPRFSAWIFSVLSGLSVLLTAIGVYSVIAYTSTLRAGERRDDSAGDRPGPERRGRAHAVAPADEPALWGEQQRPGDVRERGCPAAWNRSGRRCAPCMAGGDTGSAQDFARRIGRWAMTDGTSLITAPGFLLQDIQQIGRDPFSSLQRPAHDCPALVVTPAFGV